MYTTQTQTCYYFRWPLSTRLISVRNVSLVVGGPRNLGVPLYHLYYFCCEYSFFFSLAEFFYLDCEMQAVIQTGSLVLPKNHEWKRILWHSLMLLLAFCVCCLYLLFSLAIHKTDFPSANSPPPQRSVKKTTQRSCSIVDMTWDMTWHCMAIQLGIVCTIPGDCTYDPTTPYKVIKLGFNQVLTWPQIGLVLFNYIEISLIQSCWCWFQISSKVPTFGWWFHWPLPYPWFFGLSIHKLPTVNFSPNLIPINPWHHPSPLGRIKLLLTHNFSS